MTVMEGSLSKWTNVMKGWQYRWFVLDDNAGLLSYYTSKEKMMRGVRRGCVRLKGAVIGIDDEDDSTFTITVDHKTFHFQGRDAEEREQWVRALEDTIMRHATMRSRWDLNRTPPTLKDFDNKVSEADAYLQIMIDQTKDLENRIHEIKDKEEQDKCRIILSHANTMLDNIKHTIVLLQIAKNTAHPVNGIYQGPTSLLSSGSVSSVICTALPSRPIGSEQGIEVGADCLENARRQSRALSEDYRKLSAGRPITLSVPETSYSSSEGEDDFFDANDSPFTPGSQVSSPILATRSHQIDEDDQGTSKPVTESDRKKSIAYNENNLIKKDGTIDYDALYEDNMEDDGCDLMQESVISHLISQIKIGMDLTKVVLPTFILERRSLLEMYADYLAHPDMFVKIAELKDPRDRMVQVVKWYLSSYHAGRNSSVAKKPYNPILGEVFRCHWDLPSGDNTTDDPEQQTDECVTDGPIPWCTKNQLTFVAEQVSHHPPISAFYGEHFNKGISFSGHVYTKSKFLGLSVCVYNIGQGIVNVIDYNEDYVVTFPIGYGRSILTVPWIELGGNVTITCAKTGYHADINFLTKPFYGTKKHRITCDVFGPNEQKPFLKINGEWNGVMEAKWADGTQEQFIDVSKLSVVKKIVRPIAQQEDNESRKLWKEVTAGLRFNKIEHATDAKTELEQRQREEARLRKENNVKWETKLFKPIAEGWYYLTPLSLRLTNKSKENGDLVQ